jgi:hypothetical protein
MAKRKSARRGKSSIGSNLTTTHRWLLASLAAFGVMAVVEWLVHDQLLADIYRETASIWRAPSAMRQLAGYMWLGWLIFAPFFALIYTYGYQRGKPGWEQGLRFGLLVGLMIAPMSSLMWYVVLPIPGKLAFYWFLDGLVVMVLSGVTVGLIYREGR